MKFTTTLALSLLGLTLSGSSMAADCVTETFTNVVDNSWSAVTWDEFKTGDFNVTLKQNASNFGAWGKNGKLLVQVLVDGQWEYVDGHNQSGEAYHGANAVTDTVDTDKMIPGKPQQAV